MHALVVLSSRWLVLLLGARAKKRRGLSTFAGAGDKEGKRRRRRDEHEKHNNLLARVCVYSPTKVAASGDGARLSFRV